MIPYLSPHASPLLPAPPAADSQGADAVQGCPSAARTLRSPPGQIHVNRKRLFACDAMLVCLSCDRRKQKLLVALWFSLLALSRSDMPPSHKLSVFLR